jgi:nucleoside diphosphate kinase
MIGMALAVVTTFLIPSFKPVYWLIGVAIVAGAIIGSIAAKRVQMTKMPELVAFMSRGPVVALVVEGPEDAWEVLRTMMGATNPKAAAPGTIRGDYGTMFTENLIHGSDSAASAAREIGIFFPNL